VADDVQNPSQAESDAQRDEAFEWLERALKAHDPRLNMLNVDPRLDSLRSAPRFQGLLRRMNFPQ
jgi:hypothetical protein